MYQNFRQMGAVIIIKVLQDCIDSSQIIPSYSNSIIVDCWPSMEQREESSMTSQEVNIQKKKIIFRNPKTRDIITEIQVPKYIKMTHNLVCDLSALRNKLKMLYTDVMHRGFHPIKGFEKQARNIFKPIQFQQSGFSHSVNVTPITSEQAVSAIWKCLGRQIGRPIKKYPIKNIEKQLFDQLNSMRKKSQLKLTLPNGCNFSKDSKQYKYLKLQQQLQDIQKLITKQFQSLQRKYDEDNDRARVIQKKVSEVIRQQILSLERQIFLKTLVGIRQLEQNTELVQLILQQPYPSIKMSRQIAIKKLGQNVFNQKWQKYQLYCQWYNLTQSDILVCHRCLIPVNQMITAECCNDECASLQVGNTLLTDPYIYNRMVINQNFWEKETRRYMHPYLTYYKSAQKETQALCNRVFCNKCSGMQPILRTAGHCGYCQGICDCQRCQGMDLLTKMMAILVDSNGNLKQVTDQFIMQPDSKAVIQSKKKQVLSMRENQAQFRQLYECLKENKIFSKRNQIKEYQRIDYFSQRIESDARQKFERYKQMKLRIEESNAQKLERKQKQMQQSKRIKEVQRNIGRIQQFGATNYKSKKQKEQSWKEQEKQMQKKDNKKMQQESEQQKEKQKERAEAGAIYYDDSSSSS